MSNTNLKKELRKYIELTGKIRRSAFSGVTLVTPSIDELCAVYETTPDIVAEVLISLNINSGITNAN